MHDASLNMYNYVCILHIWKLFFGHIPRDPKVSVWPKAGRTLPSCRWPVPGRVYGTGRGRSLWLWNGIWRSWSWGARPCRRGMDLGMQQLGHRYLVSRTSWYFMLLFGTAAALGWKVPTLCYSAIIRNLAILNPACLRGLVPLKPTASSYFKNSGPWAVFFPWQEAAEASQQAMLSVAGLDKDQPEQHISCIFLHWLGCVVLLTIDSHDAVLVVASKMPVLSLYFARAC